MLAHDIRSALGGCINAIERLPAESLDVEARRFRDGALTSALAASRLFDGAMDLEAIENDAFALSVETTRLEPFLSETYRRWNAAASAKGLKLEITRSVSLPDEIDVDRVRLARVLGNIIENAIKYTQSGRVSVAADFDDDGDLRFQVADNGPGFSPQALDQLFAFKGRPDDAEQPGSGLGLHISNLLVGQMGGRIGVAAAPGGGALVSVCLPGRMAGVGTEVAAGALPVLPSDALPDLSHLNILLAEDNATNQMVVTQMLEAMGARFSVACDGLHALQLFEEETFDLALLDIEMPRLSGLEVIRTIRARKDERAATPIVALTAYAMRTHQEKISEAGANGLIAKPILGIEELGDAILTYWRRRPGPDPVTRGIEQADNPAQDEVLIDPDVFAALEKSIGTAKMSELLSKVVKDLADVRDGLSSGIGSGDARGVRSASHVLISVAGAIGAISTQQQAEWLNRAANAGDWEQVNRMGEACLERIVELLGVVESKLT